MKFFRLIALFLLLILSAIPLLVEAENPQGGFAVVNKRGRQMKIYSTASTVGEALRENALEIDFYEYVRPASEQPFYPGMTIELRGVQQHPEVATIDWQAEPRQRVINSRALPTGRQVVVQGGQPGNYHRPRVIINGVTGFKQRQIEELQKQGPREMLATAYSPHYLDTAPYTDGLSAIGVPAGYGLIAVDPRIIPLGTFLYVEGYGYGIAADVGGAIRGEHVDLCFPVRNQALLFGRQMVRVHIIG